MSKGAVPRPRVGTGTNQSVILHDGIFKKKNILKGAGGGGGGSAVIPADFMFFLSYVISVSWTLSLCGFRVIIVSDSSTQIFCLYILVNIYEAL